MKSYAYLEDIYRYEQELQNYKNMTELNKQMRNLITPEDDSI